MERSTLRQDVGPWVSIRLMQGWRRMDRYLPFDVRLKKGDPAVVSQLECLVGVGDLRAGH